MEEKREVVGYKITDEQVTEVITITAPRKVFMMMHRVLGLARDPLHNLQKLHNIAEEAVSMSDAFADFENQIRPANAVPVYTEDGKPKHDCATCKARDMCPAAKMKAKEKETKNEHDC